MYLVKPKGSSEVTVNGQKIPMNGIQIEDNSRVSFIRHAQRGDITLEKIEDIVKPTKAPKGDAQ